MKKIIKNEFVSIFEVILMPRGHPRMMKMIAKNELHEW
jgi:hypothetical protein